MPHEAGKFEIVTFEQCARAGTTELAETDDGDLLTHHAPSRSLLPRPDHNLIVLQTRGRV